MTAVESLTPRQRETLQMIAEGANMKEIASAMQVGPKTAEYHRAALMKALKLWDVPGLVRLAVRAGLIE